MQAALKILVVDDEPDLAPLIRQKFRRQIREGALDFTIAHDVGFAPAVTGGVVYRGERSPTFQGRYVFGDASEGGVYALSADPPFTEEELIAPAQLPGPVAIAEDLFGELELQNAADDEEEGGPGEEDSEVVRLANNIIRDAYRSGVSDIHIEPYGERDKVMVRFRQDGHCKVYKQYPPEYRNALVSRLKIMARLDISERRKPQDGKIRFQGKKGGGLELRVATIPTSGGYCL